MRSVLLIILIAMAGFVPAHGALVYLNDNEVMDAATGYVWLDLSLTLGMGVDNTYTQNGWQIADVPNGDVGSPGNSIGTHPFSLFNGLPESSGGPHPFNPSIATLVAFLAGDPNAESFSANTLWDGNHIAGISLSYEQNDPNSYLYFDGSEAFPIEDFDPNQHAALALYRQATATELAIAISNGSFELGTILGWQSLGDVSLQQSSIGITPTHGSYQAVITTLCGDGTSNPDAYCQTLNLEQPYSETNALYTEPVCDELDGLGNCIRPPLGAHGYEVLDFAGVPIDYLLGMPNYCCMNGEGSAIRNDFEANAGDRISVDYNYATLDGGGDYGFLTLADMNTGALLHIERITGPFTSSNMPLCERVIDGPNNLCAYLSAYMQETGYRNFAFDVPHTGAYRLSFAVFDIEEGTIPTAILIDNLTVTRATDTDGDGVLDQTDNCILAANPTQLDANHDGYGNACDADLNNSGQVTAADYAILRSVMLFIASESPMAAAADLNGSGQVTAADYSILRSRLNALPGPSALSCAGTMPCPP